MFRPSTVTAERLGPQPAAAAGGARPADHVLLELGLDVLRVRLAVAPLEVGDEPLEGRHVRVLAALVAIGDEDPLVLGGAEQVLDRLRRAGRGTAPGSPSRGCRRWPRGS